MYDLIIIGAGTAGLTAAIYASRASLSVLVLEGHAYGGQIITAKDIANYPAIPNISGVEFAQVLLKQATDLGVVVKYEQVNGIHNETNRKIVHTAQNTYECTALILATGSTYKPLGIDHEKEFIGKGISYCATCDGAFYQGKTVAVVGGGNAAVQDAMTLSQLASQVYVIHRREALRAEPILINQLQQQTNVTFLFSTEVSALIGDQQLTGLILRNNESYHESTIAVDGVFVAIGQMPKNEIFDHLVTLDENGYIVASEDCKTSVPGIFAAGDCRTKEVRQLATASADGAVSALAAAEYIRQGERHG